LLLRSAETMSLIKKVSRPLRLAIRSISASRTICTVILLGLIALVVPRGDLALSQSGTTPYYTAIDLHPAGFTSSISSGGSSRRSGT